MDYWKNDVLITKILLFWLPCSMGYWNANVPITKLLLFWLAGRRCCWQMSTLIHCGLIILIVWFAWLSELSECLNAWFVWLPDLSECLNVWLVWLPDCLIVWMSECLDVWMSDSTECLIAWMPECLICLIVWMSECLIWLIDWLTDWLIVWMSELPECLIAWMPDIVWWPVIRPSGHQPSGNQLTYYSGTLLPWSPYIQHFIQPAILCTVYQHFHSYRKSGIALLRNLVSEVQLQQTVSIAVVAIIWDSVFQPLSCYYTQNISNRISANQIQSAKQYQSSSSFQTFRKSVGYLMKREIEASTGDDTARSSFSSYANTFDIEKVYVQWKHQTTLALPVDKECLR